MLNQTESDFQPQKNEMDQSHHKKERPLNALDTIQSKIALWTENILPETKQMKRQSNLEATSVSEDGSIGKVKEIY